MNPNDVVRTVHVEIVPNPDPGMLYERKRNEYRYLVALENPLSYEQIKLIGELLLQFKTDRHARYYCDGAFRYETAHIPSPIDFEREKR